MNFVNAYRYLKNMLSTYRILTDLDAPKGAHLMGPHEEGSLNIVTLMLTGRATPYLHNGVVYVGDEDHYVYFKTVYVKLNEINIFVMLGTTTIRNTSTGSSWASSFRK